MKTIFIVFKKNEFGHTRISCFFYHIGQTAIFLRHSELGIDQILNRIEEQKGELTHCACLTSLVQLHHCAHIIYYIYILYIHITFTFYGQCWLFRQHNLQFIMQHILIVSKQNYAQHFYYLKKWSLKIGCVKISSFFWLKYRLSFG